MIDLAVPPYDMPLNLTMQTVATVVLWTGTLLLLAYAVKMSREERSPLPVLIVLAVAAGSLIEPLYDIAHKLYWLEEGGQWTLFTSFGLAQPVWVMPAYVMVFALPALLLYRRIAAGAPLTFIFAYGALTVFTTAAFEIIAINVDLYTYYGEAPMRVAGYPFYIGFLEAAQITGFAVLAAALRLRATRTLHLFFPANFAFDTLGAGFPVVIATNVPDPSMVVMWLSAILSMAFAAIALWWTSQIVLRSSGAAVADEAMAPQPAAAVEERSVTLA